MVRKFFSFGGTLLLGAAMFLATPGLSQAQRGHAGGAHFGGAHFGGAHFGGARFGGFRGGFNNGGYFRPFYGGYGGWSHNPYYGSYWGSYGYYPYYGGYYDYFPYDPSYSGSDRGYSSNSYQPAQTVLDAATFGGSIPVSDQSSSASAFPAQLDTRAHVTVTAPRGAKVWFDGTATSATEPVRQFVTPPLAPGRQYTYWARANWNENGQEVKRLQPVEVTAGAHIDVSFPAPPKAWGKGSGLTPR
jgi:uncharacterized protein (TIGR03000 family)